MTGSKLSEIKTRAHLLRLAALATGGHQFKPLLELTDLIIEQLAALEAAVDLLETDHGR